ncbi:hypothetical protein LSH36_174g07035 [Paralvinella palmiformis]|uniref:Uncharacterized protein n=1 Tax=Paralvinella palmiformis TaxID=53620 RepID=A0AAD9JS79_9ANNE|nr:hypothetical protein LSH36_174g07035 [Paralvinella palmiformis]
MLKAEKSTLAPDTPVSGASHNHDPYPASVCVIKANLKSLAAQTREKPGHLFAKTLADLPDDAKLCLESLEVGIDRGGDKGRDGMEVRGDGVVLPKSYDIVLSQFPQTLYHVYANDHFGIETKRITAIFQEPSAIIRVIKYDEPWLNLKQHKFDLQRSNLAAYDGDTEPLQTLPDTGDEVTSEAIQLPEVLSMFIKYGFARFWKWPDTLNGGRICNSDEVDQIRRCGIQNLYGLFEGKRVEKVDFNKALDRVCRFYAKYSNCIVSSHVESCLAIDRSLFDTVYTYLCNEGRQALMNESIGQCLSNVGQANVARFMLQGGCQDSPNDITSTIGVMFSIYHGHGNTNITQELPGIRDNLARLCLSWHTLEKCFLPAYRKLCGSSAEQFYLGLLKKLKLDLVKEFSGLSENITDLARCSPETAARIAKEVVAISGNNGLKDYMMEQADMFKQSGKNLAQVRQQYGICSPVTTTMMMNKCFWIAASGTALDELSFNKFCRFIARWRRVEDWVGMGAFERFAHCYNTPVKDCPEESKIDLISFLNSYKNLTEHLDDLLLCPEEISSVVSSITECGITIPDLENQFILEGFRWYMDAQQICNGIPLHVREPAAVDATKWIKNDNCNSDDDHDDDDDNDNYDTDDDENDSDHDG